METGKLKLPNGDATVDSGRALLYLPGEMDVTEDVLGDYVSGAPFVSLGSIYKWSKLAESGEETLKLSGEAYKIIQPTSGDLTITESNGAENVIILGTIDGTLTIENGAVKQLTYIGDCNNLSINLRS